jgi:hypothetical protein
MKPPIVMNESTEPYKSGDVMFFDSVDDACKSMDPIDVRNHEYFVFDADSEVLDTLTDGKRVWLAPTGRTDKAALLGMVEDFLSRVETERGKAEVKSYLSRLRA